MFRFTSVAVKCKIEENDSQYTENGHSTYPGTMGDHGLWEGEEGEDGRRREGREEERREGGEKGRRREGKEERRREEGKGKRRGYW